MHGSDENMKLICMQLIPNILAVFFLNEKGTKMKRYHSPRIDHITQY